MVLALLAAAGCAVCYGVASVLQARGARATPEAAALDPRLLVRVARQSSFLVGSALDAAGFVLQFAALRVLPLFVVQAAEAAGIAVTAVTAVPLLGVRLARRQWLAVAAVCVGLALLGVSAGAETPRTVGLPARSGMLGAVGLLVLAGWWAGRRRGRARHALLGVVAGLGFGLAALAVRALPSLAVARLVRDPAAYAALASILLALLLYAAGLQRGAVTAVAAAAVVGETALPAAAGVLLLGDRPRPGFLPMAAVGFVLAVAGALALSRFADLEHHPGSPPPTTPP